MFGKWTPEQWSAIGTVLSAVIAFFNLIVVVILMRYNKITIDLLKNQSADTRAQAAVALQTLSELNHEKKLLNGKQLLRTEASLQDLNDRILILKEVPSALHFRPLKTSDWYEINALIIDFWPEGIEKVWILDRKLREIDIDMFFLSKQQNSDGVAHLLQLLSEAHPVLIEIRDGLLQAAIKDSHD